jgi:hypothetical protein
VWNANATSETMPDQHAINALLGRLPKADRRVLAELLRKQFIAGVHTVLVTLHEAELEPFDKGYEGTPFHDFVGRLAGWKWPSRKTTRW